MQVHMDLIVRDDANSDTSSYDVFFKTPSHLHIKLYVLKICFDVIKQLFYLFIGWENVSLIVLHKHQIPFKIQKPWVFKHF